MLFDRLGTVQPGFPSAEQFLRLQLWLESTRDPLAFSAILQVWLYSHGITWPKGVFEHDLAAGGTGWHKRGKGDLVHLWEKLGRSEKEIARSLYRDDYDRNPQVAVRRVRDAKRHYKPGQRPLDSPIADRVTKLLDLNWEENILSDLRFKLSCDIVQEQGLQSTQDDI